MSGPGKVLLGIVLIVGGLVLFVLCVGLGLDPIDRGRSDILDLHGFWWARWFYRIVITLSLGLVALAIAVMISGFRKLMRERTQDARPYGGAYSVLGLGLLSAMPMVGFAVAPFCLAHAYFVLRHIRGSGGALRGRGVAITGAVLCCVNPLILILFGLLRLTGF